MKKPAGYDDVQAFTGESNTLPPGGYICRINGARSEKSATGKDMLVISFDLTEGEYKGFYRMKFDSDIKSNPDAKWQGVYRQLTEGDSLSYFKGMIEVIQESNPGFSWNWDENSLKGLLFGGVFRREEYLKDGQSRMSTKLCYIRTVEAVRKGVKIPEDKMLNGKRQESSAPQAASSNGNFGGDIYNQIHEDDCPF